MGPFLFGHPAKMACFSFHRGQARHLPLPNNEGVMPYKPRKPCKAPRCAGLTHARYCDKHQDLEKKELLERDARRERSVDRGYDWTWAKARVMFLNRNPLCFDCSRPATLVHHVKPIADGGERLDFENMVSLCVHCHGKRHGGGAVAS